MVLCPDSVDADPIRVHNFWGRTFMSTTLQTVPTVATPGFTSRIASVDIIRGAVMVLMAIDHVRVYSGLPAGGPTPGIFFTRWITHFCAPAFIFLAGTGIFFYARKHTGVSRHLMIRGSWLVILELTVLRLAWTFNFDFGRYEMAGVIWVIGCCMILMAALVKLPLAVTSATGVIVVAAHNLLDSRFWQIVQGVNAREFSGLWKILYFGFYAGPVQFGPNGPNLIVLYSIVPWIGVITLGYGFGRILTLEPRRRNKLCWLIGLGAVAVFLVLRGFNLYGEPRPWHISVKGNDGAPGMPAFFSFLNCTKYPASLDFLLMTLGPIIALIPWLEHAAGFLSRALAMFGRVPFFFYLLHIPLIHALALLVSRMRLGFVSPWLFTNHPMGNPEPPGGYMWSLGLLYLVWGIAIVCLYFVCTWFADVKAKRTEWWLKYL